MPPNVGGLNFVLTPLLDGLVPPHEVPMFLASSAARQYH